MKQQAKKAANLLKDPALNSLFEVDILNSESEEDLAEDQKAEKMVYALLNNEFDDFRKISMNKKYDPFVLKHRIEFLTREYLEIQKSE